jgi:2-polyprenyl-3-methyl-5-hydroxy-6-metoxy-1,4-benzoquinol methylase
MSTTDTSTKHTPDTAAASEELAVHLVEHLTASLETLAVHIGLELGLYNALDRAGSLTATQLAEEAGIHPRYAREWLEGQAVAGFVAADQTPDGDRRRYHLTDPQREVFVRDDSPFHVAPGASAIAGIGDVIHDVVAAYRTGGGVSFSDFGRAIRHGIGLMNRPMFVNDLAEEWLPAVPEIHARLKADPPARVLDVGCGTGSSSVALARAYPHITVDGLDLDPASVDDARVHAKDSGVDDRVSFRVGDAAEIDVDGAYELVTIFEALHDMGDPVGALRAVRRALTDGGSVLLADERVGEEFSTDPGLVERMMYGWSVVHCVPATMAETPVEVCGTVLRAPTVRRLAEDAGFSHLEVLPIENDFWRFYRLR